MNTLIEHSLSNRVKEQFKIFQNLYIESVIHRTGRSTVYLVQSMLNSKRYVMKTFPYDEGNISKFFQNEQKLKNICHSNIITPIHIEPDEIVKIEIDSERVSYALMEFAPYGTVLEFIKKFNCNINETLIRTYFHQLIQGFEFLHSNGFAHLDLKIQDLVIAEDYLLKIIDFETAIKIGEVINTEGTVYKRAPEIKMKKCQKAEAADIFSAGIILFGMVCEGEIPQMEEVNFEGIINLYNLLQANPKDFWKIHCLLQKKEPSYFDDDFKTLFSEMTKHNPENRATIKEIKKSKWYNGPIYHHDQLKKLMQELLPGERNQEDLILFESYPKDNKSTHLIIEY